MAKKVPTTTLSSENGRDLHVTAPAKSAAGWPAVLSTLEYSFREAGLSRSRALLSVNQTGGFDCPGCAWPDPRHRSSTEFCENGARAVADEATTRTADASFFAEHSVEELRSRSDHWLNHQGRLTEPMVLRPGRDHYAPISWAAAFELVAEHLRGLATPDEALFYTSGRTSNEAAFLFQLFVRNFGTNNLPDCANLCHESSGFGMKKTVGVGKGTVSLRDFDEAEVILVIGQNPGTNHPRMLSALESAKHHGATIVSINPLEEAGLVRFKHPQTVSGLVGSGTALTDLHLRVRLGGDVALLLALQKLMLEAGHYDRSFVEARTEGFEAFVEHVRGQDLAVLSRESGVSLEDLRRAAELLGRSKATIACWAMGITQHDNGVANVQSIINLLLMGGHFGRPGAGACPTRGHSNVQGDRTVGIAVRPPPWAAKMGARFGFEVPEAPGLDVIDAIKALQAGQAKVLFALGGNLLSASPDTDAVAEGIRKAELSVQVSTKLNRSHLVTGETALILPCLGRTERDMGPGGAQFVTVENSMGVVSTSRGALARASGHLLSEVSIVAGVAQTTLPSSSVPWSALAQDYDRIRDLIEAIVPGFEDYNRRVREPNGFELPNPVKAGRFATPSGKGQFTVHAPPELGLPEDRFWLMTIRSHDQFNTTVYDLNDRYRGVFGERNVVLIAEADIARRGFSPGERVRVTSHFRGERRTVDGFKVVPYDIPAGNVAAYFPEANPLVPLEAHAEGSKTPASKRIEVSIEALGA